MAQTLEDIAKVETQEFTKAKQNRMLSLSFISQT